MVGLGAVVMPGSSTATKQALAAAAADSKRMTLLDLFDGALADRGASAAYGSVTYDVLHAGARRVATKLAELGLRRGDRLALYVENRIGFVYAYLAGLRLGVVLV